ncbi:MAG: transcriptional regulator, partial [Bacteroidetes bacterium]|nr:transcriptional regulator [Bacteroidota bacterium]
MQNKLNRDIIKTFSLREIVCFSFEDVASEYLSKSKKYISKVLGKMVADGSLMRLKKGLYHIVPLNEDVNHFIPDWHLVAKYLMRNKEYYIGYYSAMQIHGLITQPSLKEIIVTNVQVKPGTVAIKNTEFQFVHHIEKRF